MADGGVAGVVPTTSDVMSAASSTLPIRSVAAAADSCFWLKANNWPDTAGSCEEIDVAMVLPFTPDDITSAAGGAGHKVALAAVADGCAVIGES